MQFHAADYVLGAVTVVAAVFGLFVGFSGALGFCAGAVAAGLSAKFGYALAKGVVQSQWMAALATLAASLVAFGIARALVKRVVKGLLAQPADAIFGSLVAAATGAGVTVAALFLANQFMDMNVDSTVYAVVRGFVG